MVAIRRHIPYAGSMPLRYDDPDKLTAAAAIAELGLKDYMFYALVRQGEIPKHVDPLHTYGYYLRSDIEHFKRRLERGDVPRIRYPKKSRRQS